MSFKNSLILLLLLPITGFGQEVNDSLLTAFYNRTITAYFTEGWVQKPPLNEWTLIETDMKREGLLKSTGEYKFRYISNDMELRTLLGKSYDDIEGRPVYRMNHKVIAPDTLDVNIGGYTISQIDKKHMMKGIWCGGTMGYIPDGRFVYNRDKSLWEFTSGTEIMERKTKAIIGE